MPLLAGVTTKNYISSFSFLDERDIWPQVLNVTNEDATIFDLMDLTGKMSLTTQPTYSAFFNNYLFRKGVISAVGAGADAGDADGEHILITLTADAELPVPGEIAMFTNKKSGRVTSVNKATRVVDVQSRTGVTLNVGGTSIAAAQNVIFFSNAYDEGGVDPEGKRPDLTRTENQIQIFKTANKITDLQKAATIEVVYGGEKKILYKMQHDTLMLHRAKISNAFLVGEKAKYAHPTTGEDVWQTQGLRAHLLGGDGTVYTTGGVSVTASGSPDLADFKTMSRTLDKRGAPSEYHMWSGGDFAANFDDLLTTATPFVQGGISYNDWGSGDGSKRALDLGVTSFKIYDRTFHKKVLKVYDHPELFGATGFDFANEAYLIPTGKIKVDANGGMADYLSAKYMDGLKMVETETGKFAKANKTTEAIMQWSYESVCGLQLVGSRLFGIFQ